MNTNQKSLLSLKYCKRRSEITTESNGEAPHIYNRLVKLVENFKFPDEGKLEAFKEILKASHRIICVGVGRSGGNAEVFTRFIRNLGFEQVYGPDDIPYVLKSEDVLIAFSGSGVTTYTLETARIAHDANAKIVSLTSNVKSPLAELSDLVIEIPGKEILSYHLEDYYARQLLGVQYAPLTPIGTLYELRAMLFSLSFAGSLIENNAYRWFKKLVEGLKGYIPSQRDFQSLYYSLPKPRSPLNPLTGKTVVVGEGFSGIVGSFFVTRLRHCCKPDEDRECYFWKDKGSISIGSRDMVLIISGSGSHIPSLMAEKAKSKGARVVSITSYVESPLALNSNSVIVIPGRIIYKIKGLRSSYLPKNPLESIFELRTLFFLESFIYLLAVKENVTEADMLRRHSEFT
ncbi:SIS domain-containing protein [Candidatus Bathyarchaeota archaeon]|nr:SIS domain-containing protein [Candidatus Bathyarchaeota archaeon]